MFFYVSKVLTALTWPSNLIALALVAGVALMIAGRAPVAARRLVVGGVSALALAGFSPLGHWLVLPLENRFARPALPEGLAGIIMLGGFESPGIGKARRELALNEAGERLTETMLVARARPDARIVFTGGDASLLFNPGSAAGAVGQYLEGMGFSRDRIVLEGASRTTFENAVFLRDMLRPKPGERWLLVTSAYHMPRSIGTFRQAGFDVVAWPADYRTRGAVDLFQPFGTPAAGLERVDLAVKEWVGLVVYRLTGRSVALWPGP